MTRRKQKGCPHQYPYAILKLDLSKLCLYLCGTGYQKNAKTILTVRRANKNDQEQAKRLLSSLHAILNC
jgi:hypothetical protein